MNWRELLKFDPMRELRSLYSLCCDVQNRIALVQARLDHPRPEPPPPRYIVIWGKSSLPSEMRSRKPASPTSEEHGAPAGVSVRASHDCFLRFKMTRWLLIGDGRVSDVIVGNNVQACVGSGVAMSGIAGRMVGIRITFEVVT